MFKLVSKPDKGLTDKQSNKKHVPFELLVSSIEILINKPAGLGGTGNSFDSCRHLLPKMVCFAEKLIGHQK